MKIIKIIEGNYNKEKTLVKAHFGNIYVWTRMCRFENLPIIGLSMVSVIFDFAKNVQTRTYWILSNFSVIPYNELL